MLYCGLVILFVRIIACNQYALMMDAGSSGTRIHIFTWDDSVGDNIPNVKDIDCSDCKSKPGLSKLQPDEVGPSLGPLIDAAKELVPEEAWEITPLFLKATAGMRLLPMDLADEIIANVRTFLSIPEICPFDFKSARIISGDEEGAFGWISANFLMKNLDEEVTKTTGFLDLGGASTQLAFVPNTEVLANYFPISLGLKDSVRYDIYTHSFLTYGQDQLQAKANDLVVQMHDPNDGSVVESPCFNPGFTFPWPIDSPEVNITGTGNFDECRSLIVDNLLLLDTTCLVEPCSINGVYSPPVTDVNFVAVSAFFFSADGLHLIDDSGVFDGDLNTFIDTARDFCASNFSVVDENSGGDSFVSGYCWGASQTISLLVDAYEFPANQENIIEFRSDIDQTDTGWALGATIYELNIINVAIGDECPVVSKPSDAGPYFIGGVIVLGFLMILLCMYSIRRKMKNRAEDVVLEDRNLSPDYQQM